MYLVGLKVLAVLTSPVQTITNFFMLTRFDGRKHRSNRSFFQRDAWWLTPLTKNWAVVMRQIPEGCSCMVLICRAEECDLFYWPVLVAAHAIFGISRRFRHRGGISAFKTWQFLAIHLARHFIPSVTAVILTPRHSAVEVSRFSMVLHSHAPQKCRAELAFANLVSMEETQHTHFWCRWQQKCVCLGPLWCKCCFMVPKHGCFWNLTCSTCCLPHEVPETYTKHLNSWSD